MASSKDDVDQPTDSYSLLKNPYKDLDDGRQRFLLELEFVQCLANPTYIHYDEYATASENDPKILLTTSRELSQHLGQFVKELKLVFPNVARMNRGSQVISEIIEFCRAHEYIDVIFVHEHRGEPDNLVICHLPFGPTAFFELLNVFTNLKYSRVKIDEVWFEWAYYLDVCPILPNDGIGSFVLVLLSRPFCSSP
ncbi:U3 small nucleolar ribonucleoprotein protein IMP4-like [Zingiber officinale]|uniref:U3 small nucleolar ribonucleoprotein protein IMP4-like n=1 Tax=Zingiber officinale TaxID=94328 RepID=UPI001C4B6BA3|nr:U3 small nucleolar ribonucleoprotein protein IMP4-like [Zingiber officinale]